MAADFWCCVTISRAPLVEPCGEVTRSKFSCLLLLLCFLLTAGHKVAARGDDPTEACLLGLRLADEGKFTESLAALKRAISLNPAMAQAYDARARVWNRLAEYQNAILDCNKCLDLDAGFAPAYCNRAAAFFKLKQFDKALDDADKALALDKSPAATAAASRAKASALIELGKAKEALTDCDTSIELEPKFPDSYYIRARAYNKLERYNEAVQDCAKSITLYSNSPSAYEVRAEAYRKLGHDVLADNDLAKAKQLKAALEQLKKKQNEPAEKRPQQATAPR